MKRERLALLALAAVLFVLSRPMLAHHSGVVYDREHPITLTGTVTEFEFINPHAKIHFEAKDENGNVVKWVAESAPPQTLFRRGGWTAKSLKPGDEITVTGAPSKKSPNVMSVVKLEGDSIPVLTQGAE